MDGLVGGGGEHEQLVPLVGEQAGVRVDGDVLVEGQAPRPLNQLHHDVVSDQAQAVRELSVAVVQQVVHVLKVQVWFRFRFIYSIHSCQ